MGFDRAVRALVTRRGDALRAMYVGGKGNATARWFARVWAWAFGKGIMPGRRWVTLEVPGRKTGNPTRFPLGMATVDGQDYLGAMLGNDCNWVRNVRANDGDAIIERRRRRQVHLMEVPVAARPPLLREYLRQVPGARPHIPVAYTQPVADFESISADYPVFAVRAARPVG
ncbi:nitroreductase/quinone reductase family protein [Gordonia sp. VNK1]|uniref:nitroreductase/quinone reductase family protein n=1 Tax=Gordonia oleivorans TaxID=3156618 RepID=UPI0032B59CC6